MPVNSSILKLKQKLKEWNWAPEGLTPQQRRIAWALGGFFGLLLLYFVVISPIWALEDSWATELAQKRQLLARYQALIQSQARMAQAEQALKGAVAEMEGQFLTGANAAMAGSDLLEILKNLTTAHGAQLTSTKILQPRDTGPYVEVPIQVQLSGTIDQLLTILYHLEHHKKLLFLPEMEINAPRWMMKVKTQAAVLQVSLVVAGVMRKPGAG
jgi:type II secretory pathway component PulM